MQSVITRAVLAATDLSPACDEVLRAAAELARRSGAELHVVHAFDFPPAPYVEPYHQAAAFPDHVLRAEAALEAQIRRVVPPGVKVAGRRMEIYAPHRAIAEYAEAVGAGVIVMGPHTKSGMEPGFLGTTADRVIRMASVPVLIVRGALRLPLHRVVAPLDLSEPARGALDVALAWTDALGAKDGDTGMPAAELRIVHVIPNLYAATGLPFSHATILPGVNREVEAALERAGGAASVDVQEELLWGDRPDDEIVAFAERERADLVILATHGYGAFRRALIGATAGTVARRAPCPVLLVPPKLWRGEADEEDEADRENGAALATA